jgi:DNA-binding NarL/FixJ family response regulator
MNVAIIEDHRIIAESLNSTLSKHSGIKEIRLFFSSDSFLNNNNGWNPHLIISDLLMPGISGAELIKAYKAKLGDQIKIIILSSVTNKATIKHVIRQGANGYLSKEEPLEELIKAIHKVIDGERYISESLRNKLANNLLEEDQIAYHLSPREKDVLRLVCSGRIMKEIADDLGLSIHTVQSYHNNVMRKFKVRRTSDLIVAAIRNGFYNPEIDE